MFKDCFSKRTSLRFSKIFHLMSFTFYTLTHRAAPDSTQSQFKTKKNLSFNKRSQNNAKI